MVSKTSLLPLVRAHDWRAVEAGLTEKPSLIGYRDERRRNWLHIACASPPLNGAENSIAMADMLLAKGISLHDHAFTEGNWKATPVWFAVAFPNNLPLIEHLLKLGADPDYSLFAASWNHSIAAIDLLVKYGARLEDERLEDDSPFLGAVQWSHFDAAEALLRHGAKVDYIDSKGMTAAHYMLKKGSDFEHFEMLARYGARFDIPGPDGKTAADIMSRKKDPRFRELAGDM